MEILVEHHGEHFTPEVGVGGLALCNRRAVLSPHDLESISNWGQSASTLPEPAAGCRGRGVDPLKTKGRRDDSAAEAVESTETCPRFEMLSYLAFLTLLKDPDRFAKGGRTRG
jgi:hypothetical protein